MKRNILGKEILKEIEQKECQIGSEAMKRYREIKNKSKKEIEKLAKEISKKIFCLHRQYGMI